MYGLGDADDGVRWTLKVAVFGATGSTGSLVARCAVQRGHATVAVSRSRPGPGQLEGCESRVGDMTNPGFAAEAIRGCDAVITANAEAIMKSSRASWTIVRSVGLTNADKDVDLVDRGGQWTSFDTMSRTSLARFLVECAESRATIHKTITVGERKP